MTDENDRAELLSLRKQRNILALLASDTDVINHQDICTLISPSITCNELGDVSAAGIEAQLQALRTSRPYLFFSSRVAAGMELQAGVAPQRQRPDSQLVYDIFGAKSSSIKAAALHRTSPETYSRLKKLALEMKIID
jgi:hypothetical protein